MLNRSIAQSLNRHLAQAYYARLRVKDQIIIFNQVLERQYHLTRGGVPSQNNPARGFDAMNGAHPAMNRASGDEGDARAVRGDGGWRSFPVQSNPNGNENDVSKNDESGDALIPSPELPNPVHSMSTAERTRPHFDAHFSTVEEGSEFVQNESDAFLPSGMGPSFFPRNFSLSDLGVDLQPTEEADLPTFAAHEEDAMPSGLKRNFSELSDL
jgi:hypothetical protein